MHIHLRVIVFDNISDMIWGITFNSMMFRKSRQHGCQMQINTNVYFKECQNGDLNLSFG